MNMTLRAALIACSLSLFASPLLAEPLFGPAHDAGSRETDKSAAEREHWRPGFGARVGGYGFRNEDGSSGWDDCRMGGIGVFGTLDANRYLFGELSLDVYQAAPEVVEEGLDRVSTHTLAGVGLRMLPEFVLTPFVELGGGIEWTKADALGASRTAAYPLGFLGFGAELNLTREFKLGATLRMLGTAEFEAASESPTTTAAGLGVSRQALEAADAPPPESEFAVAAQGQFHLRYAL